MKREMHLIHALLEYAEAKETGQPSPAPSLPSYTAEQVHYHLRLCKEAGYLRIKRLKSDGYHHETYRRYQVVDLTWAGHEALVAMRAA